ncbi:MAG TPA: FAD-binding oxidoreductase [Alphaproteobacteria bacterium]|jgi:D-lactate dehydrogenase (cytochrome)|nr:FAD-binding oxidoreductase [Alphaproteobacteria bacterium]
MAGSNPTRATQDASETLRRIREVVGPKGIVAGSDAAPYLTDQRGLYQGNAALIVRPGSVAEVAEVVRLCAGARIPIVPQGGNTGLVGASVPFEHGGEIVLNLGRLNRVREIDPLNDTMTVEAGCILADVQKAAAEADRLFPLTMASEGSCQIGGVLSTNAGGTAVLRYGTARDLVLGIEVVLADGRVLDLLSGLRKDNTGYDLKQLFLGAEGTLGIITAAVLKLFPRPRETATALVALRDLAAAPELLARARAASGEAVVAFELMSGVALDLVLRHIPDATNPLSGRFEQLVLMEMTSAEADGGLAARLERLLTQAFEAGLIRDAAVAASEAQRAGLWRLRESLPEAQKREGASIKHDVAVPVSAVPEFIAQASRAVEAELPGIRVVAFGHAGDGNIHFNLSQPEGADREAFLAQWAHFNRIVHDIAVGFGGTISAEHGIGRLKREELARTAAPLEIELMRRLKAALDPLGILNPGKVI